MADPLTIAKQIGAGDFDMTLEAAIAAGARAERERIKAVMDMPEAAGREGIALQCALTGDMPEQAIRFVLSTVPRAAQPIYSTRKIMPRHLRLAASASLTKGS
ncbi:MAG: hypothetical protein R3D69_10665 [Xanthobacteraceae bacterium]